MPWTNKPAIDDQFLEVGLEAVKQAEELILRYFNSRTQKKFWKPRFVWLCFLPHTYWKYSVI